MLCGLIHSLLRIKEQIRLWIWRDKYGYFYCKHCCIACEFFDECMDEFIDRKYHPAEYAMGEGFYQQDKE